MFVIPSLDIKLGVLTYALRSSVVISDAKKFGGKGGCTHIDVLIYFVICLLVGVCVITYVPLF